MAKLQLSFDEFLMLAERVYKYRGIQRFIQKEALGECDPLNTSLADWVPDPKLLAEIRNDYNFKNHKSDVFLLQPKTEDSKSETKE